MRQVDLYSNPAHTQTSLSLGRHARQPPRHATASCCTAVMMTLMMQVYAQQNERSQVLYCQVDCRLLAMLGRCVASNNTVRVHEGPRYNLAWWSFAVPNSSSTGPETAKHQHQHSTLLSDSRRLTAIENQGAQCARWHGVAGD